MWRHSNQSMKLDLNRVDNVCTTSTSFQCLLVIYIEPSSFFLICAMIITLEGVCADHWQIGNIHHLRCPSQFFLAACAFQIIHSKLQLYSIDVGKLALFTKTPIFAPRQTHRFTQ